MRKKLLCIICSILILSQLPVALVADVVRNEAMKLPQLSAKIEPYDEKFALACDDGEMLYGIPTAEFQGKTYGFADKKLYAVCGDEAISVLDEEGDNINIVDDTIYFTTFENNEAYIKAFNLTDNSLTTIMSAGNDLIYNFYVVNGRQLYYLSNGAIYRTELTNPAPQKLDLINEAICNFIPTNSGILYGTGSAYDCSLYLDSTHLLDNVRSYYIESDHLVVMISGILYQLPTAKLRSFCNMAKTNSSMQKATLLPYLEEYNLQGYGDAVELLNLDNPDDAYCEYCETHNGDDGDVDECSNASTIEFTRMRDASPVKAASVSPYSKMITSQANKLLNFSWSPLKKIKAYNNSSGFDYFLVGQSYTGIPYNKSGPFSNNHTGYIGKSIRHIAPDDPDSAGVFGLNAFNAEIRDSSSDIYNAAITHPSYGPLYGMNCSCFVSYSWGLVKNYTTTDLPSLDITKLGSMVSTSDLTKLSVGDSLIKQKTSASSGHAILIYNLTYNSDGSIKTIVVAEERPPITRKVTYTPSSFLSKYGKSTGYEAYKPKTYTVTFNYQGGTGSTIKRSAIANVKLTEGGALPTGTRNGYTFAGWSKTSGGAAISSQFCITASRTLYARWIIETVASIPIDEVINTEINTTGRILDQLNARKELNYE